MSNKNLAMSRFGKHLRAYRLGYRVAERFDCFVKISEVGENFLLIFCPTNQLVPSKSTKLHICWWEGERGEKVFDFVPALKNVKRFKKLVSFVVNQSGEIVD